MRRKTTQPLSFRKHRVVVIGGGYSGALAANRLQQRPDVDITVVNARPIFVERIRLHEMVAGSGEATRDLAAMLGKTVRLVVGTVERIDVSRRSVELTSGETLPYDYLIYAVGSTGAVPSSVPGAREFAYPIAELEQAERVRAVLADLPADASICVVGGGLTGIEAASELAEQRPTVHVTLVCGKVLAPSIGEKARRSVRRQLTRLGVEVLDDAVVAELDAGYVRLTDGRELPSALTVWTAGFGVPELAARSGLSTDELGRLVTDETLTSIDDPRIVAAGDAAAPSNQPLRMGCQAALPLGAKAANTVLDRIEGKQPGVVDQAFVGQNISIGRRHGTIQLSYRDDTPRRIYLVGKLAASVKEFVCRSTVTVITKEARKPGAFRWPTGDRDARAPQVVRQAAPTA
ncbi:NAD(P)/FAD-dependent oxidoreductase [Mycobacterium marseillense]|jgi:NADH dehydrogenase|uniref:Dehydrogenase n=1 Tax=Mycobacterium marseillense TaxID=701042 RepID=A0AAD0DUD2_9MYCO|nr:FAD-dependent oxidoreductase [Mycobacterium marseillense]ASW91772.1 FAD-dependent oxidoreductase [Mycobacterium marseillense]MCV7407297.1 FAD-dependent oxidoreductase [Mycobacterium marseillense]ORA94087.1 FAD-dependent oxidoreductase [Mycobacterium marseillense]BBY11724.1 dehydrogenase [Mycobacterium marseillense]